MDQQRCASNSPQTAGILAFSSSFESPDSADHSGRVWADCDQEIQKLQHFQVLRPDTKDLVKACHPLTSARALATFNFERVVLGNETFEVTLQQYALACRLSAESIITREDRNAAFTDPKLRLGSLNASSGVTSDRTCSACRAEVGRRGRSITQRHRDSRTCSTS